MNTKYIIYIATVVAIVSIASAAFAYVYYEGQIAELRSEIEGLQTLVDDHGYVLSLASYPKRIISISPSSTEILFALGVGDKVVGVTDYCNYPYNFAAWVAAGNMTSIGGFSTPNMEAIASLKPDLIITTGTLNDENAVIWRNMGYNVLALDPTNLNGVLQDIVLVGRATDSNAKATQIVNDLTSRINAVAEKVAGVTVKPKVYYEIWYDPIMSIGGTAWENELIQRAGGVNVFADQSEKYFVTSSEAVINKNPEVILLPSSHGLGAPFWGTIEQVKARAGWSSINAVKNNNLNDIDSDTIARAGPRVADAIEMLAKIFHPELF